MQPWKKTFIFFGMIGGLATFIMLKSGPPSHTEEANIIQTLLKDTNQPPLFDRDHITPNIIEQTLSTDINNEDHVTPNTTYQSLVGEISSNTSENTSFNGVNDKLNETASLSDESTNPESVTQICSNQERISYLQSVCKTKYGREPGNEFMYQNPYSKRIFVNHRLKLVYCLIPKVASTTLRTYFTQLHKEDISEKETPSALDYWTVQGFTPFFSTSKAQQDQALKEYFKLIVVRHPWDRLISSWMNKANAKNFPFMQKDTAKSIIKKYIDSFPPGSRENRLNFADFFHLIGTNYRTGFHDGHWADYDQRCSICDFPYDHIFRTETFAQDADMLYNYLKSVNASRIYPQIGHENKERDAGNISGKLLAVQPFMNNITNEDINNVLAIYGKDMEAFGYHWSREEGATCKINTDHMTSCC